MNYYFISILLLTAVNVDEDEENSTRVIKRELCDELDNGREEASGLHEALYLSLEKTFVSQIQSLKLQKLRLVRQL